MENPMGTETNSGKGKEESLSREKIIIRTSLLGIGANVLLAAFKAVIGMLSHSIAVVLDAVNNLSDALSSVITIIGTKIAGRAPDRKHPFGHGRAEYLTAMIISVIILYAGVTSLLESVKKILHPETPDYTPVALLVIAVAVVVKVLLGTYVKKTGQKVNSDSLVNSGEDARLDAVISASTLAAAVIFIVFHVSLEAWLGAVISVIIIKSGIDMLRVTISQILGERVESELTNEIKRTIAQKEGVYGAYDLILNNYGPDRLLGSVHIEVPDTFTADQIDRLSREIQQEVCVKHHVILTGIGVYSMNTTSDHTAKVRSDITRMVMGMDHILSMHGFYLDEAAKTIRFDVIVDFAAPDMNAAYAAVCKAVQEAYPDYQVVIALDRDISD